MSGALGALLGAVSAMLNGLMTVGSAIGFQTAAYGASGSLSPSTFVDHGGTTRTVVMMRWSATAPGSTVSLRMSGASIPNTNTTFVSAQIAGFTALLRSAAGYTADDGIGATDWSWGGINTTGWPSSGTCSFVMT